MSPRAGCRAAALLAKRLTVLLALLVVAAAPAEARTVTDSAGRKVEVPDKIEKVFAAGPPASILLYMLAPTRRRRRSALTLPHNIATCRRWAA